jgi:hypothetical protein
MTISVPRRLYILCVKYKIKDVFFTTTLLTQLYVKFGILVTCGKYFSPPVFWWVRVAHLFSFLCCPIMCLYVLSSIHSDKKVQKDEEGQFW